jgi:cytochrome b561
VLVLAQFVVSFLIPDISMRTPPSALVNLHLSLGVTIPLVMAIRFVHRLAHPAPISIATTRPVTRRALARSIT